MREFRFGLGAMVSLVQDDERPVPYASGVLRKPALLVLVRRRDEGPGGEGLSYGVRMHGHGADGYNGMLFFFAEEELEPAVRGFDPAVRA